jgi:hypothetical protein
MINSTKNGLRQKCHGFRHIRVDPLCCSFDGIHHAVKRNIQCTKTHCTATNNAGSLSVHISMFVDIVVVEVVINKITL